MIPRLRRILWSMEDNSDKIMKGVIGFLAIGAFWLGLAYLLFAGEFK